MLWPISRPELRTAVSPPAVSFDIKRLCRPEPCAFFTPIVAVVSMPLSLFGIFLYAISSVQSIFE